MIYYTSSTGTIIGSTSGSDLTGITHLPSGADYAVYVDDTTVSSLNPSNQPGTYSFSGVTASTKYTVPTATGTLQFTVLPAAQQLANAQSAQINAIKAGLASTIAGGFTSKSTGHTYVTTEFGESNMHAELTRFALDSTLTTVKFFTIDAGWVAHTQAQIQSAFLDGGKWKDAQYAQEETLIANVQSATTVAQAQSFVWTPATY